MARRQINNASTLALKEGQCLKGWLLRSTYNQGTEGNSTIHSFKARGNQMIGEEQVSDGDVFQIWGSAVMDDDMAKAGIVPGCYVEIENEGKVQHKTNKNKYYWKYSIYEDDEVAPLTRMNNTQQEEMSPMVSEENKMPSPSDKEPVPAANEAAGIDDDLPF